MARVDPPESASPIYKTLHETAVEFIRCQDEDGTKSSRVNYDRIRAIRSRNNFQHSWGHNYLASSKPSLSGILDLEGFINHLDGMTAHLKSWDTTISDIVVDEVRLLVVVRASYYMVAKGAKEPVENDLVWFLTMDSDGKRVKKAVEFIDGTAAQELGKAIQESEAD